MNWYISDGPPTTTPTPTTTPSVPFEEIEDGEGDEADNDYEKAKPHVAESGKQREQGGSHTLTENYEHKGHNERLFVGGCLSKGVVLCALL